MPYQLHRCIPLHSESIWLIECQIWYTNNATIKIFRCACHLTSCVRGLGVFGFVDVTVDGTDPIDADED